MDSELKLQLQALIDKTQDEMNEMETQDEDYDDADSIANDPIKQLESIIKKEPSDGDDDYYYVLVIDDKEKVSEVLPASFQPEENTTIKQETEDPVEENDKTVADSPEPMQTFENSYDSFSMSNTKVPVNVPATILENEEGQEIEQFDNPIDMDATRDSTSQDTMLPELDKMEEATQIVEFTSSDLNDLGTKNNIIKILTASGALVHDGSTILLKSADGIEYVTSDQFEGGDDDPLNQEEVIAFDGDDASQLQVLKCDGSELVIEYADGDQIATVLQQEDGTFLCDCGEELADLDEYEKHQVKHNPAGDNLCTMCGKGFESPEILSGHMLLHSVTGLLVYCPFCNQLFRRNTLTQHIKYSHNNIKPRCHVCDKTFANPNNLKRHMMIHSGIKDFECDICFKKFSQKITMQSHRLTHMNPFSCNQCDKTFDNKIALQNHKDSNDCSMSKLKKVKDELMKTVKQEITTSLGKLLGYACSLCKKMFSVESALEQHVESTHMVDPAELLCSECGEVMPSKKDMQAHLSLHKNSRMKMSKRFECSCCGKGCSSHAMLLMHERVHTNERPFPCNLCSLRFKTKTHLRTHQLTHTREKKFGCSVCMKFFALKGNLVVHLRTHTGERPYVCSICNEAFIDSKYLKKHKLKKHSIENVPWNQY